MNKISKIIWSLFSGAMCLMYKNEKAYSFNESGATRCQWYYGESECGDPRTSSYYGALIGKGTNCKTVDTKCMLTKLSGGFTAQSCTSCPDGYTLTTKTITFTSSASCSNNSTEIKSCVCNCTGCEDTGTWTKKSPSAVYEQRIGKGCVCGSGTPKCETTTHYRCAQGYYGEFTTGTPPICTECPGSGATTFSEGGSTNITDCYLPSEFTYSDNKGKFVYNCDCPYNGKNSCSSSSSSAA